MERNQNALNRIGMFDLIKGVMMIIILSGHAFTNWRFDFQNNTLASILMAALIPISYVILPTFFMICGYGFRKTSVKKCAKTQVRYLWKPYLGILIAIVVAELGKRIFLPSEYWSSLKRTALPYLLGFSPGGREFLGIYMDSIGPVWFFLVFVLASILLSVVLQEKRRWAQIVIIAMLAAGGILLCDITLPWSIQKTMICCGYLYVGWLIKKHKFLQMEYPKYLLVIALIFCIVVMSIGGVDISQNVWQLGMIDLLATYILGVIFLCVSVRINFLTGKFSDAIRWLGRRAMWVGCIHTIDYIVLPWDEIANLWPGNKFTGLIMETAVHLVLIFCGCLLLEYLQRRRRKKVIGRKVL